MFQISDDDDGDDDDDDDDDDDGDDMVVWVLCLKAWCQCQGHGEEGVRGSET